jgi:hypothetical protein
VVWQCKVLTVLDDYSSNDQGTTMSLLQDITRLLGGTENKIACVSRKIC